MIKKVKGQMGAELSKLKRENEVIADCLYRHFQYGIHRVEVFLRYSASLLCLTLSDLGAHEGPCVSQHGDMSTRPGWSY